MDEQKNIAIAVGRRKTSISRVYLKPGTGKITVNGQTFEEYFPLKTLRNIINQPFSVTQTGNKFDFNATLVGGGKAGQAGALRHSIARALCKYDLKFRPTLKEAGLLTRDPRMKERKKYGQKGARRRFQFSKR